MTSLPAQPQPAPPPGSSVLAGPVRAEIEDLLQPVDEHLARAYPGARPARQPVHTVYVPADRYQAGLAHEWGRQAVQMLEGAGGMTALLECAEVPVHLHEAIAQKVHAKLTTEPIEDLRIDFEDGYGDRGAAEDDDVAAAAQQLRTELDAGRATPFVGIRMKSLEASTRERGLRTLEAFLTSLAGSGPLPEGLCLTLPKVSAPAQVEAMSKVCAALEQALGLPAGRLRFEVQIETPQAILGADGVATVARMVHAGAGRVSALHYGTYDYSASLGVAGAYQSMDHRSADHAKSVMQLAVAGTGVWLSDGSSNMLPVGSPEQVRTAWARHAGLVGRSLESGFYQGWDLHPGQLLTRFAATYAFYRRDAEDAVRRLGAYLAREQGTEGHGGVLDEGAVLDEVLDERAALDEGAVLDQEAVLDEPATARALAWFLLRGLDCGALDDADLAGLERTELLGLAGR